MFAVKALLHVLESLTLDLIPAYFRRYLTVNSDASAVFNDSRKMMSKKQEVVIFPRDANTNIEEFKKEVNSDNYFRNFNSSIFAHILTAMILMLISPSVLSGVILYVLIAIVLKTGASFFQAIYLILSKTGMVSEDCLLLYVDGGLGKYTNISDRDKALNYIHIFGQSETSSFVRQAMNSEDVKKRVEKEQG